MSDSPPSAAIPAARSSAALLSDRDFGPFVLGNLLSNCGTWFQDVAAALVVFDLTGSSLLVGLVGAAQFATLVVLTPLAGTLADRIDRRRLLIAGQAVPLVAVAALAVWTGLAGAGGLPGPWPIVATAALLGAGAAIAVPVMNALVPALVGPEDLDRALALNSITFDLARAVGPPLAGLVVAVYGAAAAFGVNALSFVAPLVALTVIRPRPVVPAAREQGGPALAAGVRYARNDRVTLGCLLGVAALGAGTDPVGTLMPAVAAGFGGGAVVVGLLVAAFGLGATAAALSWGRVSGLLGRQRCGRDGLVLVGAGMLGLAVAPGLVAALAALAVAGAGFVLSMTALTTALQRRVPEALRGRVMALWTLAFLGPRPLTGLLGGALADAVHPRAALLVAAAVALAAVRPVSRRTG